MIPLYDNIPARRAAWVTWTLILANSSVFLGQLTLGEAGVQDFVDRWGVIPREVVAPLTGGSDGADELLTLITSQFIHGGWLHVIGNMLFLWVFGDNVEDRLGHLGFLGFYLAAGVAAAVLQVATHPSAAMPMVGASGAVAGVLGSYLVLYPYARVRSAVLVFVFVYLVDVPALVFLGYWFLIQLLAGTVALTQAAADGVQGGVAFWAHVGGFAFGAGVGLALRAAGPRRARRTQSPW